MLRGMVSGMFWGTIVGILLLAVLSLYSPVPMASEEVPEGEAALQKVEENSEETEVAAARVEDLAEETVEPLPQDAIEAPEVAQVEDAQNTAPTLPTPEVEAAVDAVPEPVTDAPDATAVTELVPEVEVPANSGFAQDRDDYAPSAPDSEEQVTQMAAAAPTLLAQVPPSPTVETSTAPRPELSETVPEVAPSPGESAADVVLPDADVVADATAPNDLVTPESADISLVSQQLAESFDAPEPRTPEEIEAMIDQLPSYVEVLPGTAPEPETEAVPQETAEQAQLELTPVDEATEDGLGVDRLKTASPSGVVINRLPTIDAGTPETEESQSVEEAAPETEEVETVETEPAEEKPAVEAYAAPSEESEGKPLFAVILVDTDDGRLSPEAVSQLGLPVTVALDPVSADATARMQAYRAAGIEVMAVTQDLPAAAAPADVTIALNGYFDILDEAVGLLDPVDGRIQSNRNLLEPVLGTIQASGHGIATYERGLNAAISAARREGIPAVSVFRILDEEEEGAPQIARYLDRAAFKAGQDGSVVVVGRSFEATLEALRSWAQENAGGLLAFVPVSTVMTFEPS